MKKFNMTRIHMKTTMNYTNMEQLPTIYTNKIYGNEFQKLQKFIPTYLTLLELYSNESKIDIIS